MDGLTLTLRSYPNPTNRNPNSNPNLRNGGFSEWRAVTTGRYACV